jgi:transposase-like protein
MIFIMSDIISLIQHTKLMQEQPELYSLACCPFCGKADPWRHGCYYRKSDRSSTPEQSLNPVPIQRSYCPNCTKTSSVLPECIPHRRWYLWDLQEIALLLMLGGESLRAIAKEMLPSRRTLARWRNRFAAQFRLHKDTLCNLRVDLGRTSGLADFWKACLDEITLAKSMLICHVEGVFVP